MKTIVIAAALTAAAAPVSSSFDSGAAVPPPPAVTAIHLHAAPAAPVPAAEPAGRAVVDKIVQIQGRELSLCLVRSGSAGMAVLSVPEHSAVHRLPDIAEAEFRGLVARASGCRLEGDIREVASSRGTIAISTGLDCSGAGS